MKDGLKLAGKVLTLQMPPRVLLWASLNIAHRVCRTGSKRFEFERLYLENPDPWDFRTSDYESRKYQHVLATARKWRSGSQNALEIGCSIGVFTKMLAQEFARVTAVDVSQEALRLAAAHTSADNIRFVRGNLRALRLGARYDVIFCAEILYYVREKDAPAVVQTLDGHLSPQGILITVSHLPSGIPNPAGLEDWEGHMSARFDLAFKEIVQDPARPYQIHVYKRRH